MRQPGQVIVITSGKGVVGKTTACANIATALSLLGHRVAMVDADIGLRNLDVVMGLENRIVYDVVDVVEGFCRVRQALIKDKRFEGLYLLPAAQTRDKSAVSPLQMKSVCDELRTDFDFVLVDCPAGIEQGFRNAVAGADRAIIITTPEVASVRDADRIIGLLEADGMAEPQLVLNRIRQQMVRRGDMMDTDDVIEILAIDLLGVVPEDEGIIVSTNRGEPAVTLPGSRAGLAFRNIARRIRGEVVPFMSLEENNGLLARLSRMVRLSSG
jgi:septum site-determining protein MinD